MVLVWETSCRNCFNRLLLIRINSHQIQRFLLKPYSFGWFYSYPSVSEDVLYIQLKYRVTWTEFCCCGTAFQGGFCTLGQMTFSFPWGSSRCCWTLVIKTCVKTSFPPFFLIEGCLQHASKFQYRKQPSKTVLVMKHYSCENTELTLVLFILCILLLKLKNETQL